LNGHLVDTIRGQGHECFEVSFVKGTTLPEIPYEDEDCVVLYGSHQFCRAVGPHRFRPGALGLTDRTSTLAYLSNLPAEWMLNSDGLHTTWKLFRNNPERFFDIFGSERIFLRPNSGFKTFTGLSIPRDDIQHEINCMNQLTGVMDETLVMVAGPKELLGEFRFVVAEGKVLTGSEYRWDNKLDIRIDYPPECLELAEKVARHQWQADTAYTCDVALTPHGPKVVELNSFCCAGLYACDLEKVVQGISEVAEREWRGETSL
jgi:hypothetical protein